MAVCPKCKAVINDLDMRRTGREDARMFIEGDYALYDNEEFESDGEMSWYNCPECNEELFTDWDDAEKFLKEKDEFKEMVAEKIEKIKNDNNNKNKVYRRS